MVISARPCSPDRPRGGVTTAGLPKNHVSRSIPLRSRTLAVRAGSGSMAKTW